MEGQPKSSQGDGQDSRISLSLMNQVRRGIVGVKCVPNYEAEDLEKYLGIKFTERPSKALATKRNTNTYIANIFLHPSCSRIIEAMLLVKDQITDHSAQNVYLHSANAIFVNDPGLYDIHRLNMSAFIHTTNPAIWGKELKHLGASVSTFF